MHPIFNQRAMAIPLSLLLFSFFLLISPSQASNPSISYVSVIDDENPISAAITAIADCRSKTVKLTKYLDQLRKTSKKRYDIMALKDCHSVLLDSQDQMRDSIKELKKFRKDKDSDHVGNVQTWLSAVMTNFETCSDGVDEGGSEGLKDAIGSKIDDISKMMSNTLGLVNELQS